MEAQRTIKRRRLVGVATESSTAFGRSVFRGVLQYANLQRDWVIYKDMWHVTDAATWPECDGTILGGLRESEYVNVRRHSRHLVSCSGGYDPADVPTVALDDAAAAEMAADHLVELGLKQFAFYGPGWANTLDAEAARPKFPYARRARGFVAALAKRGLPCATFGLAGPTHIDLLNHAHHPDVVEWIRSLPSPVGIMACDDTHANDLAEACRAAGVAVPDQVAIVGVNNDDLLCESAFPPLSSVECNFARMGFAAARMLDRMMGGEPPGADGRLIELPPVRVEQRMSTQVVAVGQPDVVEAVRFIREHACDPCTVDDVLRATLVSRRSLERHFQAVLGRTLHDEIAKVRVDVGRRLLARSDIAIDEVAGRCGFSTVQAFTRFFRTASGLTPAAFRRQHAAAAPLSP